MLNLLPTINWGCWEDYPFPLHAPELNSPAMVRRASNKLTALRIMAEAGVPTPAIVPNAEVCIPLSGDGWCASGGARVVPRNFNHRHGADIIACNMGLSTPDYFTEYVNGNREYRIHVARFGPSLDTPMGGEILLAQRKVEPEEQHEPRERHVPAWPRTHTNGYVYRSFTPSNLESELFTSAIAAVAALGLDFGAVDMINGNYNGHLYTVLEVNTAPGLSTDASLSAYATAFARWLS